MGAVKRKSKPKKENIIKLQKFIEKKIEKNGDN
jgi:hypothetical protein